MVIGRSKLLLFLGFRRLGLAGGRLLIFVGEARVQGLQLLAPVDGLIYVANIVTPAFAYFYEEFQKDFYTQDAFDLLAGAGANVFQHGALFANDDGFLAVALYENYCGNSGELFAFFEFFD